MKLICLDTETTGLNNKSERIIEIGCVDITYGLSQKKIFQKYINPGIEISKSASNVHGITNKDLENCKPFAFHAKEFLQFIENATLIIHNAHFDLGFLNEELKRNNLDPLTNKYIDTLQLARTKFPGQKNSLDSLMERFKINITREKHGALVDAEILAHVYYHLTQTQSTLVIHNTDHQCIKKVSVNSQIIKISPREEKLNNQFFQ